MGSFVKGWIWIWLFSNTLSLGLSLLWELASRTYRQPTKGYTAGKVIPKADLWISRRAKLVLLFHKRLNVGFLTQDRPQCIYICDRMIYIMIANMMGPRDWKIKWKCSVFYLYESKIGNSLLKSSSNFISSSIFMLIPVLLLLFSLSSFYISYRDRPTVNALLLIV